MNKPILARGRVGAERARFLKQTRISAALVSTFAACFALDANAIYVIRQSCSPTGNYIYPTNCPTEVCAVREEMQCSYSVVYIPDPAPIGLYVPHDGAGPSDGTAETVALVDPVNKPGTKDCDTEKGNPIQIATGEKVEREVDFRSDGQVPLGIERTYSSTNSSDGVFGRYWTSNVDYRLRVEGSNLVVSVPNRGTFVFKPDSSVANKWNSAGSGGPKAVTKAGDGTYTLDWPRESTMKFDASGNVTSVKSLQGIGYDFTYDGSARLSRVTATGGRHMDFTWTGTRLTKVVDPSGVAYNYVYLADRFGSGKHLLTKLDFPSTSDDDREYLYEDARFPGALTGTKLGGSRYSWFSYDAAGRAISTEHRVAGSPVEKYGFSYDERAISRLVVTETNPFGKQASYTFQKGKLESITGMPTSTCPASLYTQSRDFYGYPTIITDFNGNQVKFDYTSAGLPLKEIRGYGSTSPTTITYEWDQIKRRLMTRTVVGDHSRAYTYDTQGRVISETVKNLSANGIANQSRTTTFSYSLHSNGTHSSVVSDGPIPGTSDRVTKTYNSSGDLLTVANAAGIQVTRSGFNGLGQPTHVVDSHGVAYDMTYDSRGRRLTTTRTIGAASATETRAYDKRGRLVEVTGPDGSKREHRYDNADRMTEVTESETVLDPTSQTYGSVMQESVQKFAYNEMNEPERVEQYRRQVGLLAGGGPGTQNETVIDYASSFTDYDDLGREIANRGNGGQNVRFGHDESGNVTSVMDSFGRAASLVLDAQNRVQQQTDTAGGVIKFAYDVAGRVVAVTDPRGLVTRYVYDGFGQLWREESPDTGIQTYAYDAYGRQVSSTDAALASVGYEYDSLGRVNKMVSGSAARTKLYDSCLNGLGRVCGYTDSAGGVEYSYNPQGGITRQTQSLSGSSYAIDFEYDGVDRLSKLTYPNGQSASYAYADGRVRSITARVAGVDKTVMEGMRYTPSGRLKAGSLGNSLSLTRKFDIDSRWVQSQVNNSTQVVQGMNLGYDANNLLVSIDNLRSGGLSQSLAYDAKGRLTAAGPAGQQETFTYDLSGNRTTRQLGADSTTYAIEAVSNRVTSTTGSGLSRIWTYDANGNSNGFIDANGVAVGFHYDAFNRIDSSSRQNLTTYYKTNSLGLRVEKSTPTGTVRYIYSPAGRLLSEWSSASGWTNFIWHGDEVLALTRNDQVYYIHNDQTLRPEVITNEAKSVVWSANDLAFERTVTFDSIGGLALGFPGQLEDLETNTWNNFHRDFDATTGRYLQPDPIGLNGGINPYAYVNNNPLQFVDRTGLNPALPPALASNHLVRNCIVGLATGYVAGDNLKAAYKDYQDLRKDREAKASSKDCDKSSEEADPDHAREVAARAGAVADGASAYGEILAKTAVASGMFLVGGNVLWGNPYCSLAGAAIGIWKGDGTTARWTEAAYEKVGGWLGNAAK